MSATDHDTDEPSLAECAHARSLAASAKAESDGQSEAIVADIVAAILASPHRVQIIERAHSGERFAQCVVYRAYGMHDDEMGTVDWEQVRTAVLAAVQTGGEMTGGFPSGKPMNRHTGAGVYERPENGGHVLPDDSDITHASAADLVVTFCTVMDNMTRTNNTTSLAQLGRYAGQLWWEMTRRGVEFK